MKNLKNMLSAAGLMAVLVFGAVSANAGIMITDRATACTDKDAGILQQVAGIFLTGLNGILITDLNGIIIVDAPAPGCTDANGIMITDANGIIIVDNK